MLRLAYTYQMIDVNHDNLNVFIGLSVEEETCIYSMWAFCQRGSLRDIIFKQEVTIDETFQVAIVRDVISVGAFQDFRMINID